jgi:hypothetical protein
MRRTVHLTLLLTTAFVGLGATLGLSASAQPQPQRHPSPATMALVSTITSVAPHQPAWYKGDTHQYLLDVSGTDGRCGIEATWTRLEDGATMVLPYGEIVMPAAGWAGLFTGPLGPGQYTVKVEGSNAYKPYFPPCSGSAQTRVAAYEGALGAEFPRITGASWEGATVAGAPLTGVYHVGQPDKILDVQFQNYLTGYKWNSAAATQQGAVCTYSVVVSGSLVGGEWPDPHTAVLGDDKGGTSVYRGVVMTGVGWNATLKANITKTIAQYMPVTAGSSYTIQIKSTPFNRSDTITPCIGSMSVALKVE